MKRILIFLLACLAFIEIYSQNNTILKSSNNHLSIIVNYESHSDTNIYYLEIKALVDIIYMYGGDYWNKGTNYDNCNNIFFFNHNVFPHQQYFAVLEKGANIIIPYIRIDCIPELFDFTFFYALNKDLIPNIIKLPNTIYIDDLNSNVLSYSLELQKQFKKFGKSFTILSKVCPPR